MIREHFNTLRKLLFTADLCLVVLSFQISLYVKAFYYKTGITHFTFDDFMLAAIVIWGLVLWNHKGCYTFRLRTGFEIMQASTSASLKASGLFLVYFFVMGYPNQSRIQVASFLILSLISLNLLRLTVNSLLRYYRKRGYNSQTVIIVGRGKKAKEFADKVIENVHWGFNITGFIDWKGSPKGTSKYHLSSYRDIPYIGCLEDLPDIIKSQQVDWVVYAVENGHLRKVEKSVAICQEMGTRVAVLADFFPAKYAKERVDQFLEYPMLLFDTAPRANIAFIFKCVIDRVVAAIGIILLSPLMFFVALAIKLSSKGPILFKQERCGLNGKKFSLYKFRTMVVDAEKLKANLLKRNEMDGPAFKIKNDPRITTFGRWLRKTYIDELPQLFNVLRGDMSLVGPRPPLANEVKKYDLWQRRKLSVKPGLTCLWQVGGRNDISFEQWMKMDLEYIDNWSLWLDTKILARTIPAVLSGKGAR